MGINHNLGISLLTPRITIVKRIYNDMKIIITENQYRLLRRSSQIDSMIDPTMDSVYDFIQGDQNFPLDIRHFSNFKQVVAFKLANDMVNNESTLDGDEKVTLRNQIQRYVESNYYSKIKEYFMSRTK